MSGHLQFSVSWLTFPNLVNDNGSSENKLNRFCPESWGCDKLITQTANSHLGFKRCHDSSVCHPWHGPLLMRVRIPSTCHVASASWGTLASVTGALVSHFHFCVDVELHENRAKMSNALALLLTLLQAAMAKNNKAHHLTVYRVLCTCKVLC